MLRHDPPLTGRQQPAHRVTAGGNYPSIVTTGTDGGATTTGVRHRDQELRLGPPGHSGETLPPGRFARSHLRPGRDPPHRPAGPTCRRTGSEGPNQHRDERLLPSRGRTPHGVHRPVRETPKRLDNEPTTGTNKPQTRHRNGTADDHRWRGGPSDRPAPASRWSGQNRASSARPHALLPC
jgi:hypothetical protein